MLKYCCVLWCCLLLACQAPSPKEPSHSSNSTVPAAKDSIPMSYAQNFSVEQEGEYTILTIKTAWKASAEKFQYVLYPKEQPAPKSYPNAIKVGIPLERVLCTSTVDIAFLSTLDELPAIVALANSDYVYNPEVRKRLEQQQIAAVGNSNALDYERILQQQPEAAFVYSLGDKTGYKKLEELGIAPIMLSDFMEASPLGRAEWMRFVGYFFQKATKATTKFDELAEAYQNLQLKARLYSSKPTVLTGALYGGTWYVAGGKSLMAQLIRDAGGRYLWANNEELSGVPLDFEVVYDKALEANYWINMAQFTSKDDLLNADPRYGDFTAFKEGKLYNHHKRSTAIGGSDFFESAIVLPHLVLNDLIQLLHPSDSDSLYYYQPLQ